METFMSFSLPANAPLLLAFSDLPDPRKQRNQHYPLIDIIAVVIMRVLLRKIEVESKNGTLGHVR
jgi:hypothetical protein